MMTTIRKMLVTTCAALAVAAPATAANYSDTFFFGNSLSDTGNNAYVLDHTAGFFTSDPLRTTVPIPSPGFVASYPYENSRYSNGPVWAEYFATRLGESAQPALRGGTNYAFGGARMGPLGNVLPPSVEDQVASYLVTHGNRAPPNALYVIEGGGNDAREAADVWIGSGDPSGMISNYVHDALASILALEAAGAHNILFWSVPDIGKTPEFLLQGAEAAAKATSVAAAMNHAMEQAILLLAPSQRRDLRTFDIFGFMERIIADPTAYGLSDVTSACAYSTACIGDPSRTLFWDGLHPTTAGHLLVANAALASINPEPDVYVLFGIGLAVLACQRKLRGKDGRIARSRD
jgi:outer membrane lipase/esterase